MVLTNGSGPGRRQRMKSEPPEYRGEAPGAVGRGKPRAARQFLCASRYLGGFPRRPSCQRTLDRPIVGRHSRRLSAGRQVAKDIAEPKREKSGRYTPGSGPSLLLTPKAMFKFYPETKEMYLDALFPRYKMEDIKGDVPWDLPVAETLGHFPIPTDEEIHLLR